jgi:hypothetical protein
MRTRDHYRRRGPAEALVKACSPHFLITSLLFLITDLGCSPCLRASVVGLLFPMTGCPDLFRSVSSPLSAAKVCFSRSILQPSACVPRYIAPGDRRFVENKSPTPIRKDCDRTVEVPFLCFSTVRSGSISACFSRSYCQVGRRSQPSFGLAFGFDLPNTKSQVPRASFSSFFCQRSSPRIHPEVNAELYHLFAIMSSKKARLFRWKNGHLWR